MIQYDKGKPEIVEAIKKISKLKYFRAKDIVEQEIAQRSFAEPAPVVPLPPPAQPIVPPKT